MAESLIGSNVMSKRLKKKIFFMLELTEIAGKEHFEYSLSGEFKS